MARLFQGVRASSRESARARVPEHALALLKLKGVDDGLLVEADYNRAERTLKNGRRNALCL